MKIVNLGIGLAAAAMLLALLGLTRLLVPETEPVDLEIREIDISTVPEPPPPPPEEAPPDAPPPPPSLSTVADVPDPTRVPVPKADVPLDLSMPVDPFFTDVEPAPLPQPVVRKARPQPAAQPSRPTPRARSKPAPAPVAKSHYNVSELDGKPRLIRAGSAAFPGSLARRGVKQGTVVFEVELTTGGSVRVRRTLSSTHSELVSAARRVATGSRFTPPTRSGKRVRAIMRWPITIRR